MKKIFTLILIAAGLLFFNAASAQKRNGRYNDQGGYQVNQPSDQWNQNGRQQSKGYGYNNQRGRNNDYKRQAEYDRMNQECDQRIEGYRNDRSMNRYERNRRIQEVEMEREQKRKAFGNGMVVGGIAAILLGVLIGSGK